MLLLIDDEFGVINVRINIDELISIINIVIN